MTYDDKSFDPAEWSDRDEWAKGTVEDPWCDAEFGSSVDKYGGRVGYRCRLPMFHVFDHDCHSARVAGVTKPPTFPVDPRRVVDQLQSRKVAAR
jgi:hypothetical protein